MLQPSKNGSGKSPPSGRRRKAPWPRSINPAFAKTAPPAPAATSIPPGSYPLAPKAGAKPCTYPKPWSQVLEGPSKTDGKSSDCSFMQDQHCLETTGKPETLELAPLNS